MSRPTPNSAVDVGIMTAQQQVSYRDILRVWREAETVPQIEHAWLFDHLMPRAERTTADVDFNSPLMRLAAGGSTPPIPSYGRFADAQHDTRRVGSPGTRDG
jgi:hypothetical protein